jgi:glycosyltransferase involved in cell wall biosynthesis
MIVPVPHAPAPAFLSRHDDAQLADLRTRFALPDRFILADAYKNPDVLIRTWGRLSDAARAAVRIVFFARSANVRVSVHEAVARGEAHLIVRPSQEDLVGLYTLAAAFVFPSWIEGFGLPILEAMACGTPVIASDRHAIPEVAGGAALLMDAEDDATLAAYLARVLTDSVEADRLRQLGRVRAAEFSWARSAAMVLSVYQAAAERARTPARRRTWAKPAGESFSHMR